MPKHGKKMRFLTPSPQGKESQSLLEVEDSVMTETIREILLKAFPKRVNKYYTKGERMMFLLEEIYNKGRSQNEISQDESLHLGSSRTKNGKITRSMISKCINEAFTEIREKLELTQQENGSWVEKE